MWGHNSDKVAWGGPATLCPVLTLGGRGLPWPSSQVGHTQ